MTEELLDLEDLSTDTQDSILDLPKDSIVLHKSFAQKLGILSLHIKDFMLDSHKVLFIEGKQKTNTLECYFSNNLITVHWTEFLEINLEESIKFATDLRFLNKLCSYCGNNIVITDIYEEPSLWLYNNKIKLINTKLDRKTVGFPEVDTSVATERLPELSELINFTKKYHLTDGSLSYDKDKKFYYKDYSLTTSGIFKSNVELPLSSISLEVLKLVNSFAEGQVYTNSDFTIISWDTGCMKCPNVSLEQMNRPEILSTKGNFSLDISVFKQLLQIIKLVYNNIQITLKIQENKLFIIGYIEGKKCVEYSMDIENKISKDILEISIILDTLIKVTKEFSGIISCTFDKKCLQFTDDTYYLLMRQD